VEQGERRLRPRPAVEEFVAAFAGRMYAPVDYRDAVPRGGGWSGEAPTASHIELEFRLRPRERPVLVEASREPARHHRLTALSQLVFDVAGPRPPRFPIVIDPLYVAYEDYSAGVGNLLLTASYDGGASWTSPIQINDNASSVDAFQPNLSVAADGTVSVAFYDRRLACPTARGAEGRAAGIGLDPAASGALDYCVNASVQFYAANLDPIGNNIRLTQHTWDPQLNAPHTSSPSGETTFIGDYFGNDASSANDVFSFVSTYDDGSNPSNRQQQVVAAVPTP
jgi:hypothetical protein